VQSRPATHLLALCHSREQAEQVKARLVEWLAPRGQGRGKVVR
jgi:RNA-directed DNA polymerase